jgi:hypothetical protein
VGWHRWRAYTKVTPGSGGLVRLSLCYGIGGLNLAELSRRAQKGEVGGCGGRESTAGVRGAGLSRNPGSCMCLGRGNTPPPNAHLSGVAQPPLDFTLVGVVFIVNSFNRDVLHGC